ncbi:unnamed protein product [Heterobilharzia americana]|nr:unnamed protein product [Heterobilharzia americana]
MLNESVGPRITGKNVTTLDLRATNDHAFDRDDNHLKSTSDRCMQSILLLADNVEPTSVFPQNTSCIPGLILLRSGSSVDPGDEETLQLNTDDNPVETN